MSTGNINKTQCFLVVKCGRCVSLTTLPLSMSRLYRQCGIINISQPYGSPRPLTGIAFTRSRKYYFGGVERGRCARLTTLPPSMSRLSRQCGILNIPQYCRSPRPVTGIALLLILFYTGLSCQRVI
jgi:hypothetical protein